MKRSKIGFILLAAMFLTGCTASPEPVPTSTAAPIIERPSYDEAGASTPAFTINGVGSTYITIDFPAGFREASILTVSANGKLILNELNYDGDEVDKTTSISSKNGGTSIYVKYPSEDSPARTSDFKVVANDDVSWAISAESLGSIPKLQTNSISGTTSRVFMLDTDANNLDLKTIGIGSTTVRMVGIQKEQNISGGKNTRLTHNETAIGENYAGYIFVVIAENPDTQGWELLFSQKEK